MTQKSPIIFTESRKNKYPLHISLFIITFISCMEAGTFWLGGEAFRDISNWTMGLTYAILLLTFLSLHEFGHYFAAKYHKVDTTLPYYIPFPLIPGLISFTFGSLGAVIKIREQIPSRKALFDIGIAGPLAGFIICLIFLAYGYSHLPSVDYLIRLHPEYMSTGSLKINPGGLFFGDNIIIRLTSNLFAPKGAFVPPMNEIYHYPFLCVGWFGLFVTVLNLMPIGQLDGGHISYAIFGQRHAQISRIVWWILFALGLSGFLNLFYYLLKDVGNGSSILELTQALLYPLIWVKQNIPILLEGWGGWLFWALLVKYVIKLDHPPVGGLKLKKGRILLGIVSLLMLILSFSYNGLYEKIID